jgi:hypothetical protein
MTTPRQSLLTALAVTLCACAPQGSDDPVLYLSSDVSTFDGRTQHAVLRVQAFDASGAPGQGVVTLLTPAGTLVGGPDVTLVDGFGTATFVCNPDDDAACSGSVRLSASWGAQSAAVVVRVTPAAVVTTVRWQAVPTGTLETLNAVAVADAQTLWAVGTGGAVERLTGSTWEAVPSGVHLPLLAVAVTPDGGPLVVGAQDTILRWSQGGFEALPADAGEDYTAVAVPSDADLVLGTASGHLAHWDGAEVVVDADLGTAVLSLAVQGADVWAGGDGAMAVRSQGAWTVVTSPVLARLAVAVSSPEGLYLGGPRLDTAAGVLLLGPSDWRTEAVPQGLTALAIVPESDERFAITYTGVLRTVGTTGTWQAIDAPMGGLAAGSRAAGDLVVVGAPGISLLRRP